MNHRKREIFSQFNQILDALLLGAALIMSYFLRTQNIINFDLLNEIPPFAENLWVLVTLMVLGPFLLKFYGFYSRQHHFNIAQRLYQIFKAGVLMVLVLGLCVIFLRLLVPSRSLLLLLMISAPIFLLIRDYCSEAYFTRSVQHGELRENVLLAGERSAMDDFWISLSPIVRRELNVIQQVDLTTATVADLVETVHHHAIGRVILCFHKLNVDCMQEAINACEMEGVEVWLNANFIRTSITRPTYDYLANHPMLVFRNSPEISWALFIKAFFDRITAFVALIFLLPVFLFLAILIKLTSPGPVFFRQKRAGLYGKKFTMYKFRSMVIDAEERKSDLDIHNEMTGPVFKMTDDPRVTAFGKFLRNTSIDELPQFFNVLRGEMSLVGPRPLPDYEVDKFDDFSHRRRLSMRPGLTCLWQVRGRSKVTDFSDWVRMDLEYIDNWSLVLDAIILVRTIPVVLFASGAK